MRCTIQIWIEAENCVYVWGDVLFLTKCDEFSAFVRELGTVKDDVIGVFDCLALEPARRVLSFINSVLEGVEVVVTGSETVQGD